MRLPCIALIFAVLLTGGTVFAKTPIAATPAMGWNS
jgi:hypothetical protein